MSATNELHCHATTRVKLLRISAATIDRLLRSELRKYELRGQARTKPGTLLKHQIPIRTFAEWDEQQPGFGEIDLVGHDGGVAAGDYCQTLDFTDVATTWTETMAVRVLPRIIGAPRRFIDTKEVKPLQPKVFGNWSRRWNSTPYSCGSCLT